VVRSRKDVMFAGKGGSQRRERGGSCSKRREVRREERCRIERFAEKGVL
jgi:hypothetical protein